MTAAAFDTFGTARDLEAAGFERRQAEALASAVRQARADDRDALATKTVIAEFRADLETHRMATKADLHAGLWGVGIQSVISLATCAIVAAKLL